MPGEASGNPQLTQMMRETRQPLSEGLPQTSPAENQVDKTGSGFVANVRNLRDRFNGTPGVMSSLANGEARPSIVSSEKAKEPEAIGQNVNSSMSGDEIQAKAIAGKEAVVAEQLDRAVRSEQSPTETNIPSDRSTRENTGTNPPVSETPLSAPSAMNSEVDQQGRDDESNYSIQRYTVDGKQYTLVGPPGLAEIQEELTREAIKFGKDPADPGVSDAILYESMKRIKSKNESTHKVQQAQNEQASANGGDFKDSATTQTEAVNRESSDSGLFNEKSASTPIEARQTVSPEQTAVDMMAKLQGKETRDQSKQETKVGQEESEVVQALQRENVDLKTQLSKLDAKISGLVDITSKLASGDRMPQGQRDEVKSLLELLGEGTADAVKESLKVVLAEILKDFGLELPNKDDNEKENNLVGGDETNQQMRSENESTPVIDGEGKPETQQKEGNNEQGQTGIEIQKLGFFDYVKGSIAVNRANKQARKYLREAAKREKEASRIEAKGQHMDQAFAKQQKMYETMRAANKSESTDRLNRAKAARELAKKVSAEALVKSLGAEAAQRYQTMAKAA